jgi:hypothetical protein
LAISSITAGQANAVFHAQTVKKTSETKVSSTVQSAGTGSNKITDTVTISRQAQRAAVEADNAASSLQTDQKNVEAEVNSNVLESSSKRSPDALTIFQQVQETALQAAVKAAAATRDSAAAKAAKATQAAAEAKADAADHKESIAKAAEAAQAVAAAQNANAALAIAVAQATNAARNAASN